MVCWLLFINNDNVTKFKDVYLIDLCFQWSPFVCLMVLGCVFDGPLFSDILI